MIDVSSAACGESSTISVGATQQIFPYPGTMYQLGPLIFQPDKDNNDFDLDNAEVKLYSFSLYCRWMQIDLTLSW